MELEPNRRRAHLEGAGATAVGRVLDGLHGALLLRHVFSVGRRPEESRERARGGGVAKNGAPARTIFIEGTNLKRRSSSQGTRLPVPTMGSGPTAPGRWAPASRGKWGVYPGWYEAGNPHCRIFFIIL
ncbi:hypothetical protein B296_00046613 [Ensete ventricosum]|uniref:Uncharacterized protein n=1 Tax=Ensete ventricosum TaxID=4639 RepID=A0A426XP52_ENSVE|nr:hypothetical protein B296_00046613 [Ensete ventricosum]